jgi:hypothetical protein
VIFPLASLDEVPAAAPPAALVPAAAWTRALAVARELPEAVHCACFECRLEADEERVDFLVCVLADDGGGDALAVAAGKAVEGTVPVVTSAWQRVFDFCREWMQPETMLHEEVPFIWLEFDLPPTATTPPEPFLFFCVQRYFRSDSLRLFGPAGSQAAAATYRQVLARALALLLGRPIAPATERTLLACFAALPVGGHVLHVAPLAVRGRGHEDLVRAVLTLPIAEVGAYLERLGWRGPWDEVQEILTTLHRDADDVGIQLDLGAVPLPVLGIQFYYAARDPRWRPLLDGLVARGVCTPAKRDAVLAWPGRERLTLPGRKWPSELRRELELKLVCRADPERPLEAKAYLGFGAYLALFRYEHAVGAPGAPGVLGAP